MSEYTDHIVQQTEAMLHFQHDETLQETTPERLHEALSSVIMMEINDRWSRTRHTQQNGRRAYYFSAEYLVGRLVYNNLFNLGLLQDIKESFAAKGVDLACLEEIEDAALGNGGLGRLAACFLDSAATLDLPLMGYGLRYRFGLFKQTFENDRQRENADDWTKYGDPWSHRRDKLTVKVKFADQTVNCVPYDMPVIGYDTETVGTLRLWQCEAEKDLDFDAFNAQDYYKALENKNKAEDITRVLYPNDSTWEGKRLRIKQQYVLSSASLQNIMRDFRRHQGLSWDHLPEYAAIQLNDTHPAMSIPELIRLLMAEGLDFDAAFDAIEIAATCADVELLPAKDGVCRIEFQNEHRCTALVENGVLRITEARRHRVGLTLDLNIGGRQLLDVPMRNNALRLYLPAVTYRLLDAQTRSGDLEVSAGLSFARVLLRSASGEVEFRAAVASELRIHTASGDIEVQSSTPEQLRLESASGDVAFSGCGKSSVTVRTSSGDVEFADCDEAALDIRTASGDIDGHFSIPRTVSASSVSGDIDVPRTGSGAPCTLHTASGDISVRIK